MSMWNPRLQSQIALRALALRVALLCALVCTAFASSASAQCPKARSAAWMNPDPRIAKAHAAGDAKRFAEAKALYEEVLASTNRCHVELQFRLADTLENLGDSAGAAELYGEITEVQLSGDADPAKDLRDLQTSASDRVALWSVEIAFAGSEPTTLPTLKIDGKPVRLGRADEARLFRVGRYALKSNNVTFAASASGYQSAQEEFPPGTAGSLVRLELRPLLLAPQPFKTPAQNALAFEAAATYARNEQWSAAYKAFLKLASSRHPHVLYNLGVAAAAERRKDVAYAWYAAALKPTTERVEPFVVERARTGSLALPQDLARLKIDVPACARLEVDGRPVGLVHRSAGPVLSWKDRPAPLRADQYEILLAPGDRVVRLTEPCERRLELGLPARASSSQSFTCSKPSTAPVTEPPSKWPTLRVGVLAVGVAGAITGGVLMTRALDARFEANDNCFNQRCAPSEMDKVDNARIQGNIGFAVFGVGAGLGIWSLGGWGLYSDTPVMADARPAQVEKPSCEGAEGFDP